MPRLFSFRPFAINLNQQLLYQHLRKIFLDVFTFSRLIFFFLLFTLLFRLRILFSVFILILPIVFLTFLIPVVLHDLAYALPLVRFFLFLLLIKLLVPFSFLWLGLIHLILSFLLQHLFIFFLDFYLVFIHFQISPTNFHLRNRYLKNQLFIIEYLLYFTFLALHLSFAPQSVNLMFFLIIISLVLFHSFNLKSL